MKKLLIIISMISLLAACNNSEKPREEPRQEPAPRKEVNIQINTPPPPEHHVIVAPNKVQINLRDKHGNEIQIEKDRK